MPVKYSISSRIFASVVANQSKGSDTDPVITVTSYCLKRIAVQIEDSFFYLSLIKIDCTTASGRYVSLIPIDANGIAILVWYSNG